MLSWVLSLGTGHLVTPHLVKQLVPEPPVVNLAGCLATPAHFKRFRKNLNMRLLALFRTDNTFLHLTQHQKLQKLGFQSE